METATHTRSNRLSAIALVLIGMLLVALGVFQAIAYAGLQRTQDCLVQVATQAGDSRDAAIELWSDLRKLIASQPPSGAQQTTLASIDKYIAELRAANRESQECLKEAGKA